MILGRFAKLVPGDTYKKKLFYWNLIQYVGYWTWILVAVLIGRPIANPILWWVDVTVSEFLSNDGHIWGDLASMFIRLDLRGIVWAFSMFAVVVLSYLWAYRHSRAARCLRTGSYLVTLLMYLIWTIFFTWDPRYDYYVWAKIIISYNFSLIVILMAFVAIVSMWFGVIISNGYLIFKSWKER